MDAIDATPRPLPAAADGRGEPRPGRARWAAWWPTLVPTLVVLAGAWAYRWVDEDAFIDFRVVSNLLHGYGPVFNPGERVEVSTDPLWMLTLAAVHAVTPFVSLEWSSVLLGLACTLAAFLVAGRALDRLGARHGSGRTIPVGLLVVASIAGVWEFMTSGLEMSMVFLWIALVYSRLVTVSGRRAHAGWTAVIVGLGVLVRPELALVALVAIAVLAAVVVGPGWASTRPAWLRAVGVVAAMAAIPLATEVARAMYFAMLVPNTALAKGAGSTWWSQGLRYLWNFVGPYWLYVPVALCVPLVALRARSWWRSGARVDAVVLAWPLPAAALSAVYVVAIGGDYMHARLLLPAFFCCFLPVGLAWPQRLGWREVTAVAVAAWAVVAIGWLRDVPPVVTFAGEAHYISNERNNWVSATHVAHPIEASDYERALSYPTGRFLARLAAGRPAGAQIVVPVRDVFLPVHEDPRLPASSPLPFSVAVNVPALGVIGYTAGPRVYLFDGFSLANPIGSHTVPTGRFRPGHERPIDASWMLARFAAGLPAGAAGPGIDGFPAILLANERVVLRCGPLARYLHDITAPMTFSRAMGNLLDAWGNTTFTVPQESALDARPLPSCETP